jgi:hypothetical protein
VIDIDTSVHQSPGLVHFARRIPAAHCEQAVRIEPTEKAPPCLDRLKTVLSEREGAGTRRRPGIDQAHLDDIESAWRGANQLRASSISNFTPFNTAITEQRGDHADEDE